MPDRYHVARAMIASLRSPSMSVGWWLLVVAITSCTNLLDFFAAPKAGQTIGGAFAFAALIRVALVFWLSYALIRRLAGTDRPAAVTPALARFVGFQIGMLVLFGAITGFVSRVLGVEMGGALGAIMTFLIMTGTYLALVRLLAWQAALAVGDASLGPARAWHGLADAKVPLAIGYLVIAGVSAVHSALTHLAIASDRSIGLAGLALVDGAVSAVQLVLICALSVTAWRLATDRSAALREGVALA
jgi:hypothetical protein